MVRQRAETARGRFDVAVHPERMGDSRDHEHDARDPQQPGDPPPSSISANGIRMNGAYSLKFACARITACQIAVVLAAVLQPDLDDPKAEPWVDGSRGGLSSTLRAGSCWFSYLGRRRS
jgi:hypothetical protein